MWFDSGSLVCEIVFKGLGLDLLSNCSNSAVLSH